MSSREYATNIGTLHVTAADEVLVRNRFSISSKVIPNLQMGKRLSGKSDSYSPQVVFSQRRSRRFEALKNLCRAGTKLPASYLPCSMASTYNDGRLCLPKEQSLQLKSPVQELRPFAFKLQLSGYPSISRKKSNATTRGKCPVHHIHFPNPSLQWPSTSPLNYGANRPLLS